MGRAESEGVTNSSADKAAVNSCPLPAVDCRSPRSFAIERAMTAKPSGTFGAASNNGLGAMLTLGAARQRQPSKGRLRR
jgi:hypothetical protein